MTNPIQKMRQYVTTIKQVNPDRLNQNVSKRLVNVKQVISIAFENRLAKMGIMILMIFLLIGLFAPFIAPYEPSERQTSDEGDWLQNEDPSVEHLFGTTSSAEDIFSQAIYGTRTALITGFLTAVMVGGIGTVAGLVAGYYGGNVENLIMRFVDFAYGVPFIPFAIVLVIVLEASLWNIIFAISIILWRETARVVRSEVISIRELAVLDAAKASGASNTRIIFYHILPKVLPTAVLYSVFAIGWAIIAEAGLSFLGFSDHTLISWGSMLQAAYNGQALEQGLWVWIFTPGLCISLLVLSVYLIAQGIEELVNPQLREV